MEETARVSFGLHEFLPLLKEVCDNLAVAAEPKQHGCKQRCDRGVSWHPEDVGALNQRVEKLLLKRVNAYYSVCLVE